MVASLVLLATVPVWAGRLNTNYLVAAYVPCPGPDTCGAPQRESSFTFDTAILRGPVGKYANPAKPSVVVELRGVKDAGGVLVTSDAFTIVVVAGQVNLSALALTIPAGHPLSQIAPIAIPLKGGKGKLVYKPAQAAPPGTVAEGGGVTVYDSQGKRLATVGAQYK